MVIGRRLYASCTPELDAVRVGEMPIAVDEKKRRRQLVRERITRVHAQSMRVKSAPGRVIELSA
jgi:hypothetical protein